ncbi:MAG: YraN family protein [Patescibacteria group bacterium]|jgi:putative endonuclease
MRNHRQNLGKVGEDIAVEYCMKLGYSIIDRHYTTRFGEIDIISKEAEEVVFIEVKSRCTNSFGAPEEAVTDNKINRIIKTAEVFLADHPEVSEYRIDVIVVRFRLDIFTHLIKHIKGIGISEAKNHEIDTY